METVCVACRCWAGLMINGHKVDGPAHKAFEGSADASGTRPIPSAKHVVNGFALTKGFPKSVWDEWYKTGQHLDMVRAEDVFAHEHEHDCVNHCHQAPRRRGDAHIRFGMSKNWPS